MKNKFNNDGYLMNITVIVIIVVSFVISGCIAIVMANWNMKKTERGVQSNYYSAEMALDDIKSGIEQGCSEDIENAYSILISSLNTIPYDTLNDEFKTIYVDNLKRRYSDLTLKDTLVSYIDQSTLKSTQGYGIEFESEPSFDLSKIDDNKLYIRNIGVSYISSNDVYLSRIFTDIEIVIPQIYNGLEADSISKTDFTEFALIADKKLQIGGNTSVSGGAYAGDDGIILGEYVPSSSSFVTNKLITRGDIKIFKRSDLKVLGLNDGNAQIYAENFIISREGTHSSFDENSIVAKLKADMFIAEDTLLNAKNGSFELEGNYYGYHSNSSAFCINGVGVTADLSKTNTLWIAGTSYININTKNDSEADVLMGESLTYKGTQSMYLVPSVCIINKETGETISNPITADLTKDGDLDDTKCEIRIEENKKNGGVDLSKYVNMSKPYTLVFVESNNTGDRVYLYLNFSGKLQASKYSDEYSDYYEDYMNDRAKSFRLGGIILGENTSIRTSGNVISYDGTKVDLKTSVMSSSDDYITYKDSYYTSRYNSLVSTLQEHKTSIRNDSLFDYLINRQAIKDDLVLDGVSNVVPSSDVFVCDRAVYYNLNADGNKVLVADGDVKIQGSFKGLVVTTGDVEVVNGVTVNGLIMSGGVIETHENGNSFNATFNGDYPLLYLLYEWSDRDKINKYFNTIKSGSGFDIDNIATKNTIKYRNWVME